MAASARRRLATAISAYGTAKAPACARGYPCIGCTDPQFGERDHPYLETPKRGGIPVGLPTDMPKAWFVALASLAKAAMPERLRRNALAERISLAPGEGQGKPKP